MRQQGWRRGTGRLRARRRGVREEEEVVARGAHWVLPDPEGDTPSTDVEGRSPLWKRAREEGGEPGQARGKRRRVEEQGAVDAEGPSATWLAGRGGQWKAGLRSR